MKKIFHELVPLNSKNTFYLYQKENANFDYPYHMHQETELVYIESRSGHRIVGDRISSFNESDLVFMGPNCPHSWYDVNYDPNENSHPFVIVLQFDKELLGNNLIDTIEMAKIRILLDNANKGIEFFGKTKKLVVRELKKLPSRTGGDAVIGLFSLINLLAESNEFKVLSSESFLSYKISKEKEKLQKIYIHIISNYQNIIKVADIAGLINMSESAFSHYFRKTMNMSFSDFLIDIRLNHAKRLLRDSDKNISEICFDCGFNNLSNFNRIFKNKQLITPKNYRKQYINGIRNFGDKMDYGKLKTEKSVFM